MNKIDNNYRINDQLKSLNSLRLVGENVKEGIYSYSQAIEIADNLNLDLVEIAANSNPPVCKILDYQKFLYQKMKKEKEAKNNSVKVEVKELRFGPNTDKHDYEFKLRHAQEFLTEGNKLKACVFFSGREIAFKDKGEKLLQNLIADLNEICTVESAMKFEGKRLITILAPKKK